MASLVLPEVMLGALPGGGGGTQRPPKLVGLPGALDMALTGKTLRADNAKKMGLVDELVNDLGPGLKPGDERTLAYLKEAVVKSAKNPASGTLKPNRGPKNLPEKLKGMALQYDLVKDHVFEKAMAQVIIASRGLYPSPLRIMEVIR